MGGFLIGSDSNTRCQLANAGSSYYWWDTSLLPARVPLHLLHRAFVVELSYYEA